MEVGKNICGGGPGGSTAWVGDMGDATTHWKTFRRITPQCVFQSGMMATSERVGWYVGVSSAEGSNG